VAMVVIGTANYLAPREWDRILSKYRIRMGTRRYKRSVHRAYRKLGDIPLHPRSMWMLPRKTPFNLPKGRPMRWG
jgi:hypothetical protein